MHKVGAVFGAAILLLCASASLAAEAGPSAEDLYQEGLAAYKNADVVAAMQALERSVAMNHTSAEVLLAHILDKAEDNERAFALYRSAAEKGDPEGEFGLGTMYSGGEGVEQDAEKARHWITRSAQQGYGPAIVTLADAYALGQLGLERDVEQAVTWLEKGAESGYEPARIALEGLKADQEKGSE